MRRLTLEVSQGLQYPLDSTRYPEDRDPLRQFQRLFGDGTIKSFRDGFGDINTYTTADPNLLRANYRAYGDVYVSVNAYAAAVVAAVRTAIDYRNQRAIENKGHLSGPLSFSLHTTVPPKPHKPSEPRLVEPPSVAPARSNEIINPYTNNRHATPLTIIGIGNTLLAAIENAAARYGQHLTGTSMSLAERRGAPRPAAGNSATPPVDPDSRELALDVIAGVFGADSFKDLAALHRQALHEAGTPSEVGQLMLANLSAPVLIPDHL